MENMDRRYQFVCWVFVSFPLGYESTKEKYMATEPDKNTKKFQYVPKLACLLHIMQNTLLAI